MEDDFSGPDLTSCIKAEMGKGACSLVVQSMWTDNLPLAP